MKIPLLALHSRSTMPSEPQCDWYIARCDGHRRNSLCTASSPLYSAHYQCLHFYDGALATRRRIHKNNVNVIVKKEKKPLYQSLHCFTRRFTNKTVTSACNTAVLTSSDRSVEQMLKHLGSRARALFVQQCLFYTFLTCL